MYEIGSHGGVHATRTIEWQNGVVVTIDQTLLPHKEVFIKLRTAKQMAAAIQTMKIRGAPLIGAATAYGLALTAFHSRAKTRKELMEQLRESAEILRKTRPTAVNLFWAASRILQKANETSGSVENVKKAVVDEANVNKVV